MSAALKIEYIQPHVIDILGSTKGRDQPIMKMDKAVQLVQCLDKEVLTSDEYVFLDPFCKAGEILLATALVSVLYKKDKKIVSQEEVAKELYKNNRYFGIAPDERHFYLSRRTFYGNEKSHQVNDKHNIRNGAYLSEIDGRLNKDKFQKELKNMLEYIKETTGNKKIIAVGNPPYQEEDGGHGRSSKPIYNIFIENLMESEHINQFILVIPARWFSGGKGLDKFRSKIINSKKVKTLRYFENPHYIFPTVEIRGGICFFHWDTKNSIKKTCLSNGLRTKRVDLSTYDTIVPHIEAYSILEKVLKKNSKFLDEVVWPRKPFGIEGNYFKKNKNYSHGSIECLCEGKKIKKISKEIILKNREKIYDYKVVLPEASGGGKGKRDKILPKPKHFFILKKNQVSTETYSVAGSFKTLDSAENFLLYLQTYFSRFLLGLKKPTQHANKKTFAWVPLMDMQTKWTDKKLFKYFGITKHEEEYIKNKVKHWTA